MRTRTLSRLGLAVAFSACLLAGPARAEVPVGDDAPDVKAEHFLNSEPVTVAQLEGRLIFLELFTTT